MLHYIKEYLQMHIDILGANKVSIKALSIVKIDKYEYKISFEISDKEENNDYPDMIGFIVIKASNKENAIKDFKKAVSFLTVNK